MTTSVSTSTSGAAGNFALSRTRPVCIGPGLDATAIGVSSALILSFLIGSLLWLLFAYLRPKFRQVYGVREWFVSSEFRPKPLGRSLGSFLHPPVPLVPSIPSDVSAYTDGDNIKIDAALFPSDEEIMQRTIWHAFIISLSWTVIGLGVLPLYLINTPCLANSTPTGNVGYYSTLHELSVLRLLALVKDKYPMEKLIHSRRKVEIDDADFSWNTEIRLVTLTAITIGLVALPALCKFLREYTRLVQHRKHWMEVRCGGLEMGWLSSTKARGFEGWAETRLKDFIMHLRLSKGFKNSGALREGYAGVGTWRGGRDENQTSPEDEEKAHPQVDLQGLFTIADTSRLARLIDERDIILNNLEVAETQYINSFKLSTPLPSVIDYQIAEEPSEDPAYNLKQRISRPRALKGSVKGKRRHPERVTAPTSYVAPSSYYKLRDVRGVGRMSTTSVEDSLARRISQRVIGSRFQEIHRDSFMFGRIPLGSPVQLDDRTGNFEPVVLTEEQMQHGPNNPSSGNNVEMESISKQQGVDTDYVDSSESEVKEGPEVGPSTLPEEGPWTPTTAVDYEELGARPRPRPPKEKSQQQSARRSTFAMRPKSIHSDSALPPPHLRLQPQQPFVRPVSGVDHDNLGVVYNDIREWRTRLKAINLDIADAQAEGYNYIADGEHIKGWLLVGRGVRFLPGVQMIEGRSKEDIRYGVLQDEGAGLSAFAFWTTVGMVGLLLGISLVAAVGLALSPAPDVTRLLRFLKPLSKSNGIGAALATTLAPAVGGVIFATIALSIVQYAARLSVQVSVSALRLVAFKATFYVIASICCIWVVACGSMIFALEAFASRSAGVETVASGSVYIAAFVLVLVIVVAVISPAMLMLQPFHLWRVIRRGRRAVTPRQRFRALYPRVYNLSSAMACCLVGITLAATFSLIFPLIGLAVSFLLLLTLIAHRYLIGYVYARTNCSHTGGVLQMWILRCFADLTALQPVLLGLIFLSRRLWVLGGALVGAGALIVIITEVYTGLKSRLPGIESLRPATRERLMRFRTAALSEKEDFPPSEVPSFASTTARRMGLPRNSIASVLEMMSLTLAVSPSSSKARGPVPLSTEDLDDLSATEQAARTNPNAPPRLPPLPFMTHSEEMQGILYAPELIAPPPVIWLPNDRSGVAQSEAYDLQQWHDLKTTLDVSIDALPRQSNDSRRRDNSITS